MRSLFSALFLAFALTMLLAAPAPAADSIVTRSGASSAPGLRQLPFPRTERAASVWNERACWSQCGAYTAWGMSDCLNRDAQGVCLDRTDHSDRMCQRACRTSGGPYLPDLFDF